MGTFIFVNGLFYLIGAAVFGAIGWLTNRAAVTVRSPGWRVATAVVTALLPLILPLALGIGPALQYGLYAAQAPLLILLVAPLVLPAALGSALGALGVRRPSGAPELA